jgi:hypothetical protein
MKRNRYSVEQMTRMLGEGAVPLQGISVRRLAREDGSLFRNCSEFFGLKWIETSSIGLA